MLRVRMALPLIGSMGVHLDSDGAGAPVISRIEFDPQAEEYPLYPSTTGTDIGDPQICAFCQTVWQALCDYLNGTLGWKEALSSLPYKLKGTPFQKDVWALMCDIPTGQVMTYAEVYDKLRGNTKGAQAVGRASASNPVPLLIPCHRIVGTDKSLVGFRGGLDRKTRLLELEGVQI